MTTKRIIDIMGPGSNITDTELKLASMRDIIDNSLTQAFFESLAPGQC